MTEHYGPHRPILELPAGTLARTAWGLRSVDARWPDRDLDGHAVARRSLKTLVRRSGQG